MLEFKKGHAYTLAEVLVTLGVIGVIATMTLPAVIKNYQKKVTAERLKSTYSTLYQAVRMSEVDNGTLDTWDIPAESTDYESGKIFAETYFKPYLKNVRECKRKECFSDTYYYLDGTKKITNTSKLYTLALSNGVVISFFPRGFLAEIYADINGKKGPNTIGKDIFTLIVAKKAISQPYFGQLDKPGLFFYGQGKSINNLKNSLYACSKTEGTEYRGLFCGALIMQSGWKIEDDYPW